MRVLVVDDEPSVRMALQAAMDGGAWDTVAVASAETALDEIRRSPFDAYLVDKNLPGKSGLDLLREVRATDQDAGFILMTGYASPETARSSLELQADGYLEKPFDDVFAVCARVAELLARVQARRKANSLVKASSHFSKVKEALLTTKSAPRMRVMIVGGEAHLQGQIAERLERDGEIEIIYAPDAAQLARDAVSNPPNIVIFDESIPVQRLKMPREHCPKAVWAALVSRDPPLSLFTELIDFGLSVLVDKPFEPEALEAKLARMVAIARARR